MQTICSNLSRHPSGLRGAQQPVNSYAWRRPGGVVLIDPAGDLTPTSPGGLPVTDVFVTHVQEENVAGCLNFPNARVHVPSGDEYLCKGPEAYRRCYMKWPDPWDWTTRGNYKGHLAGAMNERPSPKPIALSDSLKEGMRIAGFEVISTPGHGKNAVTLLARIEGKLVAFCGDLICGEGQLWKWFDSDWDYGLEGGARALLESAIRLRERKPDILCPTHGEPIANPHDALGLLIERLEAVLRPSPQILDKPINFPEKNSPARGWRELLPNLHQWRDGNCNALISSNGSALLVDDGLCYWKPLPERARHHREVIEDLKRSLGIHRIEIVVPTHYHGDHIENIPELVAMDRSEVICLDTVAEVIEHPEQFNLASPLPWYDTANDTVRIDRRIKSGGSFRWREFEFEVFQLGGQTWYSLGLTVEVHGLRVLFVGDAFHSTGVFLPPVLCYNKADPATEGWAFATDRMIERKPNLLVCGHGSALRDPMPTLLRQQQLWRRRIEEYRALNARGDPMAFFDPFRV